MTVPASLEAGKSGDVTLMGKWPSNKTFTVSADKTVTMTCDIGGSQVLNVTFAGIELAGSNTVEISETKQVSVDSMNALFGNWTGTFRYNLNSTDGSSSSSSEDEDWSDAVDFTVTKTNRGAVGYTDEITDLDIPEHFVGDGENGTTEGTKYKVTSIGESSSGSSGYAFLGCVNLVSVTIPNTVKGIRPRAFASCPNLTGVTIPSSVTSIKSDAFCNCSRLTSITFTGTQEQWNAITKDNHWNRDTGDYTVHCTDGDIAKS